jgi:hypothetical protein
MPLTATVRRIGARPTVSRTQRAAPVADLGVSLTGGRAGSPVTATFTVTLNASIGGTGTARLVDETAASAAKPGTKRENAYVFAGVQLSAPGAAASRTVRITNLRANASGLSGASAAILIPVIASVSIASSTPIRVVNAEQTVAVLARPRARAARSRQRRGAARRSR